ncbi:sulfatase family protein [Paraflavitalea pollutisoli]|uniref:sulfatase family protein n=1 Tax=Paraflavitalea pollutisoli TaxID=3034143 RepID=UPI0023EC5A52|nr:arylsulfatase [Paraflavitalea sp. H1-2-19X]
MIRLSFTCLTVFVLCTATVLGQSRDKPNIIIIMTDDLGYGDLSCYGATRIQTPHIDQLARHGLRLTNGHATSATCTPSRYALMTGQYPWRRNGTGILPGDAALIIEPGTTTLPSMLQKAGYKTGIVGKWHLGLGTTVEKNWNDLVKPGPLEVGFDYSYIFPATADRVPTVFLDNQRVVALDSSDPIHVSYKNKIGTDPTGKEHPELLKLLSSPGQGHNQTIVNGIGRIGYMSGGKAARWTDEELSTTFLAKAKAFIDTNQRHPFFLYFALTEPHVPRMPATMFKGKSGLGLRGDAILQLDWTVGQLRQHLVQLGLEKNTIILFTSDNGPVLDDGYQDGAVTQLQGHTPAGILRGGKYSAFEAGTRVPWIMYWPGHIKPGVSDALVCQVDLLHSLARLTQQSFGKEDAPDSFDAWDALTGKSAKARSVLVEQGGAFALVQDNWKYIEPRKGPAILEGVDIESGYSEVPQLYDLTHDPREQTNLATTHPATVKALQALLEQIRMAGRTRP